MINHGNMPENFTSKNRVIKYKGKKKTFEEWGKYLGISTYTLIHRVYRGWSVEDAFTIPVLKGRGRKSKNKKIK